MASELSPPPQYQMHCRILDITGRRMILLTGNSAMQCLETGEDSRLWGIEGNPPIVAFVLGGFFFIGAAVKKGPSRRTG